MKKKTTLISGMTSLILVGLAATSFAGMGIPNNNPAVGTEAGNWQYQFDAPVTKADIAALNHTYDQENLALVGTEAGTDIIAGNKSKAAAAAFDYNPEQLALVGTEAGHDPSGVDFNNAADSDRTCEHITDADQADKNRC